MDVTDLHNHKNGCLLIHNDPPKNAYHHYINNNISNDEIPIEIECFKDNPVSTRSLPLSLMLTSKYNNAKCKQTTKSATTSTQNNENNKQEKVPNDLLLIKILNRFIFILFLLFIVCLNVFSLIILPYFVKKSLSIDD